MQKKSANSKHCQENNEHSVCGRNTITFIAAITGLVDLISMCHLYTNLKFISCNIVIMPITTQALYVQ